MQGYSLLVLNGPNLSSLGERQPHIYGHTGMDAVPALVQELLGPHQHRLDFYQSNSEGALIDRLELARKERVDGVVFNAGAYTHTSLAIADCLAWVGLPCVEVHLSNVLARGNTLRHKSLIAPHVIGVISGFGILSYALAVQAMVQHLRQQLAQPAQAV